MSDNMMKEAGLDNRFEIGFIQIARDPGCAPFVKYLETQRSTILTIMGSVEVRSNPTLHLAYANELKPYDDLLVLIYNYMHEEDADAHERSYKKILPNKATPIKDFFKKVLTGKKKVITPQS